MISKTPRSGSSGFTLERKKKQKNISVIIFFFQSSNLLVQMPVVLNPGVLWIENLYSITQDHFVFFLPFWEEKQKVHISFTKLLLGDCLKFFAHIAMSVLLDSKLS